MSFNQVLILSTYVITIIIIELELDKQYSF